MLTLSLLRHAKSSWKDPALADHERPLNTRGQAEAPVMGKAMTKHGLDPDLVLCSTARRTRDTLALVLPELKTEPKVIYEDGLYHGTSAEMLGILHEVGAGVGQVLLVGHNPDLAQIVYDLTGARVRFDPGSLAAIALDDARSHLLALLAARELAAIGN
jgi:phosphohistidine phosphatase